MYKAAIDSYLKKIKFTYTYLKTRDIWCETSKGCDDQAGYIVNHTRLPNNDS